MPKEQPFKWMYICPICGDDVTSNFPTNDPENVTFLGLVREKNFVSKGISAIYCTNGHKKTRMNRYKHFQIYRVEKEI